MKKLKSGTRKQVGKLTPNEFLIWALIWGGYANTLYSLQKETQLSAGALVPALAKLIDKGLLQEEVLVGPRKRREFRASKRDMGKMGEKWVASAMDHIPDC